MKKIFIILLLLGVFTCECYAENTVEKTADIIDIEDIYTALPDEAAEISGNIEPDGGYDSGGALKRLWRNVLQKTQKEITKNIESFFSLILINLLCSICFGFCQDKKISEYINIAGISAIAAMLLGSMDGMVNETVQALTDINAYSKIAMPAIFTAAAAGGAIVSASARFAALSLGLEVIIAAARDFVVPMIFTYLALALTKALFDDPLIKSVQKFIKWLMGISMTALTLSFSTFISVTGAVSGSADALAVKTTRTIISTALPVVGGMLSDAASTVLAAANMIKSSAGALSLIAVCALCAGPFVMLSVKMLLFKLASAACDMIPGIRVSGFIGDIGTALSFLLGLLGSMSIMLFISIMSVIKAVSG